MKTYKQLFLAILVMFSLAPISYPFMGSKTISGLSTYQLKTHRSKGIPVPELLSILNEPHRRDPAVDEMLNLFGIPSALSKWLSFLRSCEVISSSSQRVDLHRPQAPPDLRLRQSYEGCALDHMRILEEALGHRKVKWL